MTVLASAGKVTVVLGLVLLLWFVLPQASSTLDRDDWIWVEGEAPDSTNAQRHSWYTSVKSADLSGGTTLSHYSDQSDAIASYHVPVSQKGEYQLWVRANPVKSKLSWRVDGIHSDWTPISFDGELLDRRNVAEDDKPDLRFIAWASVGTVKLPRGITKIRFRFHSDLHHHGMLDCFVLARGAFEPKGLSKPDGTGGEGARQSPSDGAWFAFDPARDPFEASPVNLRALNETVAGENGFVRAKDGRFELGDGTPVRFWGVNLHSELAKRSVEELRKVARFLAKRGVNLVRWHAPVFHRETGAVDPERVAAIHRVVEAMRHEGIYTHLSIYFPLWMRPTQCNALDGYTGSEHPFASLYFDPEFHALYRSWWTAVLTTKSESTEKTLLEEPAVLGLELVNEDSYLFWTFSEDNLPEAQLAELERQFASWAKARYQTLDRALRQWGGGQLDRDRPGEGQLAFRPLWNIAHERTARDLDTVRFLVEQQRGFYESTIAFLRELGFGGLVTASNWHTADAKRFGPLERYSYTVGDFIDRHGYFGCQHQGEHAAWSIRPGHTYVDRSALRFDPEKPGQARDFRHPSMDLEVDGMPSMISETSWNRPNRYRSEAPLFYATYGALQDSDAIVHFALDSTRWLVKPGFWMQPWTLMSPSQVGQFPAAAWIYRTGAVEEAPVVVEVELGLEELFALEGTPLPRGASFDELRRPDAPKGGKVDAEGSIDPLAHFVGRTVSKFVPKRTRATVSRKVRTIDRKKKRVRSATDQVTLDYGHGVMILDAPRAQGVSGNVASVGEVKTANLTVKSDMDLIHLVVVSLDGKPIARSDSMLLQVMTEERNTGFETQGHPIRHIRSIGTDPWQVREIDATVTMTGNKPGTLTVTPLDANLTPVELPADAGAIEWRDGTLSLLPDTIYYWIHR
ncbi:MAG: hypothetical protein AAF488_08825 [Planctomycetota bacterium]